MSSMNKETMRNYDTFEAEMNKNLEETVGSTKIRIGKKLESQ